MTPFKRSVIDKLANLYQYNFNSGCVEYTGTLNKDGYGVVCFYGFKNRKTYLAHRLSAYLGGILDDLNDSDIHVCHKCDNPRCIDIRHLYQGSRYDNQEDSVLRKRHVNSKKEFCKHGHPLNGFNLYTYLYKGKIKRACKICKRNRKLGISLS